MVKKLLCKSVGLMLLSLSAMGQQPVFKACSEVNTKREDILSCSKELYFQFSKDVANSIQNDLTYDLNVIYELTSAYEIKVLNGLVERPILEADVMRHLEKLSNLLSAENLGKQFKLRVKALPENQSKKPTRATLSLEEVVHFPALTEFDSKSKASARAGFRGVFDELSVRFADSLNLHTYEAFTAKFHFIDGELANVEFMEPPLQPSIIQPLIRKYRSALYNEFTPDDWQESADFYMVAGLNNFPEPRKLGYPSKIDTAAIINYYNSKLQLLHLKKDTIGYKHCLFNCARFLERASHYGKFTLEKELFSRIGLKRSDFTYFNGNYYHNESFSSRAGSDSTKFEVSIPWDVPTSDTCYLASQDDWAKKFLCFRTNFSRHYAENYHHPEAARVMGLMGSAVISFTVDKEGRFKKLRILSKADPLVKAAMLRALLRTEMISGPFKINGIPVEMEFHHSFSITLR